MESLILQRYQHSTRRLFLLDYDGCLVGLKPRPMQAKPTATLRKVLQDLAQDPRNSIVIVSGRDCPTLDKWLGDLPLGFAAEHGMFVKDHGGDWQAQVEQDSSWKEIIRPIMTVTQRQISKSIIEEKQSTLTWHYRRAAAFEALPAAKALVKSLKPLTQQLHLILLPSHDAIEVKDARTSKQTAAQYWLSQQDWDFIVAVGDDQTDEDLFRAIPKAGISIKIGGGNTLARYRLGSPRELLALLEQLSKSSSYRAGDIAV